MTGAEFLRRIYELEDSIRCKEDEIQKIQADMVHLKSVDTSKDRVDGGKPMDTADKIAKLLEVEESLNADWDELIKWREVARSMISRMNNSLYKAVLMTRVVNHRSWPVVAGILHKSEDRTRHLYPLAVAEFEARVAELYPGYLDTIQIFQKTAQNNHR